MSNPNPRPFLLMVDAGTSWQEPRNRYFGSLPAALAASAELDAKWQPFVSIIEMRLDGPNVTHVQNGKKVKS